VVTLSFPRRTVAFGCLRAVSLEVPHTPCARDQHTVDNQLPLPVGRPIRVIRMNISRLHPRDELVETMRRIYRCNMTTSSGGNLSILDPDGGIWITPARMDKGELQPSDIVCVRPDGTKDGRSLPSSEFPFHRRDLRRRLTFGLSFTLIRAHWWRSASAACCPSPAFIAWLTLSVAGWRTHPMRVPVASNWGGISPRPLRLARTASCWRTTGWWWADEV